MAKAVLNAGDQKKIVDGLIAQGLEVEHRRMSRYSVKFPGGDLQVFNLGTTDQKGILRAKTLVKNHKLHWPLDPEPKAKLTPVRTTGKASFAGSESPMAQETARIFPKPAAHIIHQEDVVAPVTPIAPPRTKVPDQVIEVITPERAEQYLETMGVNRKLSENNVTRLAGMMRDNLWVYDGDPIRFNSRGELVDGQHRLWALIEADHTAEFLVVRGIDPAAMATINTGKSRTFPDIISMADPDQGNLLMVAATTQLIYRWTVGRRGSLLRAQSARYAIPNAVLLQFYLENKEDLVEAVKAGSAISKAVPGISASAWGWAFWTLASIDREDYDYFANGFRTPINLPERSPIMALRKFAEAASRNRGGRGRVAEMHLAMIIKAWNHFRDGTSVSHLVYRPGGSSPETFPEPR